MRVSFGTFFKKQVDFCNFTTSRKQIELDREITKLRNGLAKISAPSFRNLPDKLSMPAALDRFKSFKIFNIFSGDVSEN